MDRNVKVISSLIDIITKNYYNNQIRALIEMFKNDIEITDLQGYFDNNTLVTARIAYDKLNDNK